MAEIKSQADTAMMVAASGMRAQQARMRIIAENLANASSTSRTPGGDPYRRQVPIFEPKAVGGGEGVRMSRVEGDRKDFRSTYDPGHPAANAEGYVQLPNVDPLIEALDMKEAQRAYEANLNVIETARSMEMRTLDLLRK
ncbi:MAG TPA: flagellar basal body rod protein FlgC [Caulobacter sp.]|nr:flagellar basal body rod protein FlgC [Caulobacter sp.]